ncbi:hypothetical protein ACFWVM_14960 [Nocardia fluminea]
MTSPDANRPFSIVPEHVRSAVFYIQQTAQSLLTGSARPTSTSTSTIS